MLLQGEAVLYALIGSALAGGLAVAAVWLACRVRAMRTNDGLFVVVERAKKEWEGVFDALSELVFVIDHAGVVRRANVTAARAFHVHPKELVGRPLSDVFKGHPPEWLTDHDYAELKDPIFDTIFEITRVRAGANRVLVARDVGQQRRIFAELVQAEKMATVGVLSAGVAHEINNPAAYVMANLTALSRESQQLWQLMDDAEKLCARHGAEAEWRELLHKHDLEVSREEIRGMIGDSVEGMERIRTIVGTLQSITRRDDEDDSTVQLSEVIDKVVKTSGPQLRSWAASLEVVAQDDCYVRGSRGQLVQVVLNLVVNAIQAAAPGRSNRVTIELRHVDGRAVLKIRDTGLGMAPEVQQRIFDPFFTTKPTGLGTGLGLAISRQIVTKYHGTIEVSSTPGVGTTFTVTWPAVDEATDDEAPASPPPLLSSRALQVLIIDDEQNLLIALRRSLSKRHAVHVASDPIAALKLIDENAYDVILCDILMPRMDGLEVHRRVRELNPEAAKRFIFFTGQPVTGSVAERLVAAGVETLHKPLDIETLTARLHGVSGAR